MASSMIPAPQARARQDSTVRVLLLEDDTYFAELVRLSLNGIEWGKVSLEWSDTLRGALERLDSGSFDLVISDLSVPDSRGLETLESLVRATDRLIVVLTGEQQDGLREAAIGLG